MRNKNNYNLNSSHRNYSDYEIIRLLTKVHVRSQLFEVLTILLQWGRWKSMTELWGKEKIKQNRETTKRMTTNICIFLFICFNGSKILDGLEGGI